MPTNETERDERAMVRVLAERVMKWEDWTEGLGPFPRFDYSGSGGLRFANGEGRAWNPFTSWADAGMLLEALAKATGNGGVCLWVYADGKNYAQVEVDSGLVNERFVTEYGEGVSGPRAISLAAFEYAVRDGQ